MLFDLIFKNNERQFDRDRWSLLEWILDCDHEFIEQVKKKSVQKSFKGYCAVILTLQYLLQVIKDFLLN